MIWDDSMLSHGRPGVPADTPPRLAAWLEASKQHHLGLGARCYRPMGSHGVWPFGPLKLSNVSIGAECGSVKFISQCKSVNRIDFIWVHGRHVSFFNKSNGQVVVVADFSWPGANASIPNLLKSSPNGSHHVYVLIGFATPQKTTWSITIVRIKVMFFFGCEESYIFW